MNPVLEHVARRLVVLTDIIAVGRGSTSLWISTCSPGGGGGGLQYSSDSKGCKVTQSPAGPGFVRWREVVEIIRAGSTPELLERAADAHRRYCDGDSKSWQDMRDVVDEVVARWHAGEQLGQLGLFDA